MSRNRTITIEKRGANHGLHLVLTILTLGVWAVTGWPIAALMGRKTKTITRTPQPIALQHDEFTPQPSAAPYHGQQPQPWPQQWAPRQ